MVTNYQKGYQIERKALKELEKENYFVVRSSGSHLMADLVAVNYCGFRLIQLKSVRTKYYSFKKEIEKLKKFKNCPTNCSIELWIWKSRLKGFRKAGWEKIRIK